MFMLFRCSGLVAGCGLLCLPHLTELLFLRGALRQSGEQFFAVA